MLGKTLEEILGKTDFDLFPEAMARKFRQDDRTVVKTGKLLQTVEENRSDGETRYVEVMKSPVRDAAGTIIGVQVVFWDVTDREKAEAALEQERYLLHALMDNLPHNIYFKDAGSRFIRINQALAGYFGLRDPAEAVGKTDVDFFTAEHAQQAMADEQQIIRSGQPLIDKEEKETWPDGRVTWALTHQDAAVRRRRAGSSAPSASPATSPSRSRRPRPCGWPRRRPRPPTAPRAPSWPT